MPSKQTIKGQGHGLPGSKCNVRAMGHSNLNYKDAAVADGLASGSSVVGDLGPWAGVDPGVQSH